MNIFKTFIIALFLISSLFAVDDYQKVNPEYKLLNIKAYIEMYTSGESKLYEYESPHGHWYNPQGWRHREEFSVDLRRINIKLGLWNYIPFRFGVRFFTDPYTPYADSLQVIGQEFSFIIPVFTKNLNFRFSAYPDSWSGHQVPAWEFAGIWQTNFGFEGDRNYYFWNISLVYHLNTYKSMVKYIDIDGIKWVSNKAIKLDFTLDTRALGSAIYGGYRLLYKWNDDETQPPLDKIFVKHALVVGNTAKISKDFKLTYEGSWEWTDNVRLARIKIILTYFTNLN